MGVGAGQRPRQAGAGALPEEELGESGEKAEVQGTDPRCVQPGERGPGHTLGSPSATPGAARSRVVLTRLLCGPWWPRDRPGTNPEQSSAGLEPGAGRGAGTLCGSCRDVGLGPLTAGPQRTAAHTQATPGSFISCWFYSPRGPSGPLAGRVGVGLLLLRDFLLLDQLREFWSRRQVSIGDPCLRPPEPCRPDRRCAPFLSRDPTVLGVLRPPARGSRWRVSVGTLHIP